ncbi:fungal specific transcription factor [Colletotrichum nymphaeae SA-01]|uniref:Fungal specific transcription factor n=1 Tax=Colletotrichum nymphaeae SA-01 TaxID=1460502 RepID=A0A135T1U8_9PEZI|nr:fungal specific transcription factor [Colletotrichum nymphaeae SA-01]
MQRTPETILTGSTTRSIRSALLAGKNTALKRQGTSRLDPRTAEIDGSHDTNTPDGSALQSLQSPLDLQPEPSTESAENETSPAISIDPWFDSLNVFRSPVLIGEAADAAFATRFRQVITDPLAPEPIHLIRLNYASNESIMSLNHVNTPWPGPSRAKFLLEAAMKYIGRSYHIVETQAITESWKQNTHDASPEAIVLRCRTWALFAIGELYISKSTGVHGFPGMAYFAQASKALGYLDERPEVETVKLYLLLSFYSMALNRRYSAYVFAGTAVRVAVVIGLHLNIPESQLPDPMVRRHRKSLFWTAYIIDRLYAANLNHPPAIQDDDIGVDLPCEPSDSTSTDSHGDSDYHVADIRLAGLLTSIIRSVYSVRTQAEGTCANLSSRVHGCLKDLQSWFEILPGPLQIGDKSLNQPHDHKVVALHLRFYQCVILATRPLLLHALRIQIASSHPGSSPATSNIPAEATALSKACIRCAHQSTKLLTRAWIDGTFMTFDCFFTQHLFSSLTILAISSLLDGIGSRLDRDIYEEASRLLDQLKMAGNMVAQEYSRHVEVMESTMLSNLKAHTQSQSDGVADSCDDSLTQDIDRNLADGVVPAAGVPWPEPSLQELLSQPVIDVHFLEAAVRGEHSQGIHWPDVFVDRCKVNVGYFSQATKCGFHRQKAAHCTQPKLTSTTECRPVLRLMPLGGSVTHGVGSSDQNGYRKKLSELLHGCGYNVCMVGSRRSGTHFNNEHEGWRGYRIDQIEARAKLSAAKLLPHVFTVNAGSNDCLQGYKLTEARYRLIHLLDTLWVASPGSTIILSSLLVNQNEVAQQRVEEFNIEAERLARQLTLKGRKIVFVDLQRNDGPAMEDLVADGTHPNDTGYEKIARKWLGGFRVAVKRGFLPPASKSQIS